MSAINLKTSFLLFLIEAAAGARWIRLIKAISDQRFLHVPLVPLSAAAAAAFFAFHRALCALSLCIFSWRGVDWRVGLNVSKPRLFAIDIRRSSCHTASTWLKLGHFHLIRLIYEVSLPQCQQKTLTHITKLLILLEAYKSIENVTSYIFTFKNSSFAFGYVLFSQSDLWTFRTSFLHRPDPSAL